MRDEQIFEEASRLAAAERPAFLERACAGQPDQRARIENLLRADEEAAGFLQAPIVARASLPLAEKPGDVFGQYKLLQRIGEGGVGVVWMAQQERPLRRKVAFKIIKLGMDTKAVVARFEGERQALAMMDHPNIAKVFDAGATSTGRPYFVMELVRGIPITTYCDERHLTTAQRLELFIQVCEALQHAHQKGVIHRDLKPSNILVTENGGAAVPKVIDFGIAKATQGRLADHTVFTAFEQFIGTPAYMSPEQADMSSLDVDTRSDIYSLGVLLFELLTGNTPFDAKSLLQGGIDELRHRIREAEPATPSARLGTLPAAGRATVAQLRGTAPAQLAVQLRGDLDWIVMRCLEKDRTRRYETASALALDIRRHLRHEPVVARPPGAGYIAGKWIRRHRAAFVAVTAITIVLVVGGAVSTWQAIRATRAEREQSRLRVAERELRQRAETQERVAQRRAYAADMNLAQQALANDNLGLAKRLLDRHRPRPGEPDLRGWEWRYLWQLSRNEAASVLPAMPQPVSALSLSSDGSWLAVSQAQGGELSIRNLRTRQDIRLSAGVDAVTAVFSPVEPLLAIAFTRTREPTPQHRIRLWSLATRRVVAEWSTPAWSEVLVFSADGRTLVTAAPGRGGQITRWKIPGGEPQGSIDSSRGGMPAISRDLRFGAREVSPTARGNVEVIELATGVARWTARVSDEYITAIAFSEDGKTLATAAGNTDPRIHLWEAETGRPLGQLDGHRTYVAALLFWPDGRTLASAGTDQTIRLWDVEKQKPLRTLRGHELEVHSLALLPDKTTLISGAKDGAVFLWDTAAPPARWHTQVEPVMTWRFTPDSRSVVTFDQTGKITRYSGRTFEDAEVMLELGTQPPRYQRASFAADRPLIATATADNRVRVYDWKAGRMIQELNPGAQNILVIGFPASGEKLLLAYEGSAPGRHMLHEWDVATGKVERSWHPAASVPHQFALSADARTCSIRSADGAITLLDLRSGTERRLPFPAPLITTPGFSPDGTLIVTPSTVGWAKVWDLITAKPVAELSGFVLGVHSAVFSPDGERLITGSGGAEAVRMWDVDGFEPLLTLRAQGSIFSVTSFSPDGNVIGSRNALNQLHLWRAPSQREIDTAERAGAR